MASLAVRMKRCVLLPRVTHCDEGGGERRRMIDTRHSFLLRQVTVRSINKEYKFLKNFYATKKKEKKIDTINGSTGNIKVFYALI